MPFTNINKNNTNNNNAKPSTTSSPAVGTQPQQQLHPCLRIYKNGCNYGSSCKFAHYPRNACLDELKRGRCTRGSGCRFVHGAKPTNVVNNNKAAPPPVSSDSKVFPTLVGESGSDAANFVPAKINNNNDDDDDDEDDEDTHSANNEDLDHLFDSVEEEEETKEKPPTSTNDTAAAAASTKSDSAARTTIVNAEDLPVDFMYQFSTMKSTIKSLKNQLQSATTTCNAAVNEAANLRTQNASMCNELLSFKRRTGSVREQVRKEFSDKLKMERIARVDAETRALQAEKMNEINSAVNEFLSARLDEVVGYVASSMKKNKNDKNKSSSDAVENADTDYFFLKIDTLKKKIAEEKEKITHVNNYFKILELARTEVKSQITKSVAEGRNHYQEDQVLQPLRINECLLDSLRSGFSPSACGNNNKTGMNILKKFFNAIPKEDRNNYFSADGKKLNVNKFRLFFHGTSGGPVAARAIECNGFDPARRRGQAYGPGEYCSPQLAIAMGYSRESIMAVLSYVKPEVAPVSYHSGDDVVVINNPADYKSTFMLPLGCIFSEDVDVRERTCGCRCSSANCLVVEKNNDDDDDEK